MKLKIMKNDKEAQNAIPIFLTRTQARNVVKFLEDFSIEFSNYTTQKTTIINHFNYWLRKADE